MKLLIIAILLSFSLNSFAQDNDKRERIKALKVAYLTERLELSQTEAQKFWPIYNAYEAQEQQLRKEKYSQRKDMDIESLTEQEAKEMIEEMMSNENKKHHLREKFVRDLQSILSSKKVIKLKLAEDQFNKKMFEEYKKRRELKKQKP